jgi:hypothetical protein
MNDRTARRMALLDYKRSMYVAHRQMQQSIRLFVRGLEEQMAELRHHLDKSVEAQNEQIHRAALAMHTPRVVENIEPKRSDRTHSSAQETT